MLKLIIEDDEGRKTVVPFVRDEITIGRQEGNTVQLTERNVSRRHARLLRQNGSVVVEDLGSYNGVRINGSKIQGRAEVANGDLIQIGDYGLAVENDVTAASLSTQPPVEPPLAPQANVPPSLPKKNGAPKPAAEPSPVQRQTPTLPPVVEGPAEGARTEPVALDPAEAARLVLLNTDLAGREFRCHRSELIIGRDNDNDIGINHYSVAPAHAKLICDDRAQWSLVALDPRYPFLVNGKSETRAKLSSGDVVQLGKVKARFIEPGDDSAFKRQNRAFPLWAASLVVAILAFSISGLVVWTFYGQAPSLETFVRRVLRQDVESAEVARPPPLPQAITPQPTPEPSEADLKQETRARALAAAQAAYDDHNFPRAVELLKQATVTGQTDEEIAELLERARFEANAAVLLATATKSLDEGKLEEARRTLEQLKTNELAAQRDALRERLRIATAPKQPPKLPARSRAPSSGSKASSEEAQALYDEGKTLFLKQQYPEAQTLFTKCLDVDPNYAYCHMMLGSTFAKLGEPELGAQHYRQFVKLAPGDLQAPKVRTFLNQYEESKRNNR